MELQITALFGDLRALKEKFVSALGQVTSPEEAQRKLVQAVLNDEVETVRLTSDDLTRLVLEAVAYGSLLNDAEKQLNMVYELTPRPPEPFQSFGSLGGGGEPPPSLPR